PACPTRRSSDLDQPLVDAHLEVLARVLVDVRTTDDAVAVDLGRQRNRTLDLGLGPQHGLGDLARGLVDHVVVVRLEPNPDGLFVATLASCLSPSTVRDGRHLEPGSTGEPKAPPATWREVPPCHARPRYIAGLVGYSGAHHSDTGGGPAVNRDAPAETRTCGV